MTTKDYIALAQAFSNAMIETLSDDTGLRRGGIALAAQSVAGVLATDNPRFDRARFLAACGVSDNR